SMEPRRCSQSYAASCAGAIFNRSQRVINCYAPSSCAASSTCHDARHVSVVPGIDDKWISLRRDDEPTISIVNRHLASRGIKVSNGTIGTRRFQKLGVRRRTKAL